MRLSFAAKNLPFLNALEATSAMSLLMRAMFVAIASPAPLSRSLIYNIRSSRPATLEEEELPFCFQETALVLSQESPIRTPDMSVRMFSKESHDMTMAASSKSLMVIACAANRSLISLDHSICQTNGGKLDDPGNKTPPAPLVHMHPSMPCSVGIQQPEARCL